MTTTDATPPAAAPAAPPAPSPGRIVLFQREKLVPPWPAVIVEVRPKDNRRPDDVLVDLHVFPTRGHGVITLQLDVMLVTVPAAAGVPGTCWFPPIV